MISTCLATHRERGMGVGILWVFLFLLYRNCKRLCEFEEIEISSKPVPEIIDPVFAKTSPKRSFSVIENEPFG
jgi:hypothetical protein